MTRIGKGAFRILLIGGLSWTLATSALAQVYVSLTGNNTTGDFFSNVPDGIPDGDNDYDGDGQTNAYETDHGTNPLDPLNLVPLSTLVGLCALVVLLGAMGLAGRRRSHDRP